MKCLSVKNPWAALIANRLKTIELRTWSTSYRGPLLIISTMRIATSPAAAKWHRWSDGNPYVVAIANLVDCRPSTHFDADDACCKPSGEFAWVLEDAEQLTSPPHQKGRLSLYPPSRRLAAYVRNMKREHALWLQGL